MALCSSLCAVWMLLYTIAPTVYAQSTTNTCDRYTTALPDNSLGWYTTGTSQTFSRAITSYCGYTCEVLCAEDDPECLAEVRAAVSTCAPQWSAFSCSASSYYSASVSGSYTTTLTLITTSTVVDVVYPTTVPTNQTFLGTPYCCNYVTYEPVWVFGEPTTLTSYTTEIPYSTYTLTFSSDNLFPEAYPVSTPFCKVTRTYEQACYSCTINDAGTAQVYYWPDQTPGPDGSFPAVTDPTPSTVVISGNTLTSPSVYIKFATLRARDECRTSGQVYNNLFVPFAPSAVSTLYASSGGILYPSVFNFADLGPPINPAAYERQRECYLSTGCRTIYPYYAPTLSVPRTLSNIDPAWSNCQTDTSGLMEYPPIALRPLPNVPPSGSSTTSSTGGSTTSTSSRITTTTSASPCSTPIPGTPTATNPIITRPSRTRTARWDRGY